MIYFIHLLPKTSDGPSRIKLFKVNLKRVLGLSANIHTINPGLRDHDRVADLIVARRSIDRSAIRENLIF